jgi:hypothetical protein
MFSVMLNGLPFFDEWAPKGKMRFRWGKKAIQQRPIIWKNPEVVMCFPTFPPHSRQAVFNQMTSRATLSCSRVSNFEGVFWHSSGWLAQALPLKHLKILLEKINSRTLNNMGGLRGLHRATIDEELPLKRVLGP